MTLKKLPLALGLFVMISACGGSSSSDGGGSGGGDTPVGATSASQGLNEAGLTGRIGEFGNFIASNDANSFTFFADGENDFEIEGFGVFTRRVVSSGGSSGPDYAIFGETESGSGQAQVFGVDFSDANAATADVFRIGSTLVPTSGDITYTGNYGALLFRVEGTTNTTTAIIEGDVELTASFADSSAISGSIFNRERIDASGSYEDILFETSTISDGAFSGTATSEDSATDGDYTGLIVGSDGSEVVGSVLIEHDSSSTELLEVGVFTAEE
ncbi:hypothetical protein BC777_0525 [Yoonia maricola]|uniref:Transferrin-binding protein B C-lobe/N-lobe beta barrel domain-containing protein n=1 Tax=Yoonia maricola TaxID=420999 RepID=A0A2M8WL84_9RHOB|nr:hypothetical protein [Yoonia maricola]PJI91692.1 hypothetical protein BC777_0525 [Yoonia maricola]